MSYKFQRLREKIREAVVQGEFKGKLPGERALARRFHVNAKTLSKALTDLAAEGVLDRSIGRGTYVKGSAPAPTGGRWLVIQDESDQGACVIEHLREMHRALETVQSLAPLRPSFLNQFSAVIDLSRSTGEDAVRSLLVRNMPVVAVNHEPAAYSVNAVVVDVALGVSRLARDLLLAGHRRIGAIEPRGNDALLQTLRRAAERYGTGTVIDAADSAEAISLVENGTTALVCGNVADAQKAMRKLSENGVDVPSRVCVTAVGCACPQAACSGYFVDCAKLAESAVKLLTDAPLRPATLWLPGQWIDRGTLAPIGAGLPLERASELRISGMTV
ncbi:MAG TPA: GntR family transcriptional regulator [Tepidisphaeraceae bacterium]|nr:GntR family transcriptional regulator [Tepidisphaeraceae bacterium]